MSDPIFIIGSPRSGTTVVAWALSQHPQLWTGGEFHLFHRLFGDDRLEGFLDKELTFPGTLKRGNVTRAEFLERLGSGFDALFLRLSGGRRWIDQTPINTFIADTIADMFPTARFIHLLRRGQEAVNSMIHFADAHAQESRDDLVALGYFPKWATDFEFACREWARSVEAAANFVRTHPERSLTVGYDQLAAHRDDFFATILEFLQCAQDSRPANFARDYRLNSSFGGGAAMRAPTTSSDWSVAQTRTFQEIAGPTQARLFP